MFIYLFSTHTSIEKFASLNYDPVDVSLPSIFKGNVTLTKCQVKPEKMMPATWPSSLEKKRNVCISLWMKWFALLLALPSGGIMWPLFTLQSSKSVMWLYLFQRFEPRRMRPNASGLDKVTKSLWRHVDSSICPFLFSYQMSPCALPQKLMAKWRENKVQTSLYCCTKAMSTWRN